MFDVLRKNSFIKENKEGIPNRAVASRNWREVEVREVRGFRGIFEDLAECLTGALFFQKDWKATFREVQGCGGDRITREAVC